jgi:hypothetical protein
MQKIIDEAALGCQLLMHLLTCIRGALDVLQVDLLAMFAGSCHATVADACTFV